MGEDVKTNATVITMYNSVILCGDAYKGQKQLTPALIVQVGILYLDNDDDDNEQKFDKINIDVVSSYSPETCSKDTSSDSTGWEKILLLQICSLSRISDER